jgi:UPF0716 protein FxsA
MLRILILILLIVPTVEIWFLLTAGHIIGWFPTLLLCIATGVAGAWLAKREGLHIFHLAQIQLSRGQLPGEAILDGICVFAGGLFLLTPGFLSDFVGFFLLFPYTRSIAKIFLKRWLRRKIQSGQIEMFNFNRFR